MRKRIEHFSNLKLLKALEKLDNAALFDTHTRPNERWIRNQGAPISLWSQDLHDFFQMMSQLLEIYEKEYKEDIKNSEWYRRIHEKIERRK